MPEWNKPLPTVVGETRTYWEMCRQGQLMVQRCDSCNEYQFYPRGICANCWSENIQWAASSGKGTVWTFTVTYQNRTTGFDQGPYVLALGRAGGRGPHVHQHRGVRAPRGDHRDAGGSHLRPRHRPDIGALLQTGCRLTAGSGPYSPSSWARKRRASDWSWSAWAKSGWSLNR